MSSAEYWAIYRETEKLTNSMNLWVNRFDKGDKYAANIQIPWEFLNKVGITKKILKQKNIPKVKSKVNWGYKLFESKRAREQWIKSAKLTAKMHLKDAYVQYQRYGYCDIQLQKKRLPASILYDEYESDGDERKIYESEDVCVCEWCECECE